MLRSGPWMPAPPPPVSLALSGRVRDLIARRNLHRANADGARRMADSFDWAADELNEQIKQMGGAA